MTLYHGSNTEVTVPRLLRSVRTLDFGPGFYTTMNRDQAVQFAAKVVDRNEGSGVATLNIYDLDEKVAFSLFDTIRFDAPNEAWLDFVVDNRRGQYVGPEYAIKVGPVANDNVYRTIQLYMTGVLSRIQAIESFKVKELFNQVVFSTEPALRLLRFVRSEVCA